MLKRVKWEEAKEYMEFAYQIALDQSRSSYPLFADPSKTKEEFKAHFIECATKESYTTLLYSYGNSVQGVIQFYIIKEDHYLQLCGFTIDSNTEEAMREFLLYLNQYFREYDLYFGFPEKNVKAISYLKKNGFYCAEEAYNDTFIFDDYTITEERKEIVKVTYENYADFKKLHMVNSEMYWNCERMYSCLELWEIFILYREKRPIGAIYERNNEIFGIDYENDEFCETTYLCLVEKVLNLLKVRGCKYMTFFHDEESQASALTLGFVLVGRYCLYIKKCH